MGANWSNGVRQVPAAAVAAAGIPAVLPIRDSNGFVMVNLVRARRAASA